MQKVLIAHATHAQIRDFAINVQQIDKVPGSRDGAAAALLESGYTQDFILVDTDAGDVPAATQSEEPASAPLAQVGRPTEKPYEMPTSGFGFWTRPPAGAPKCPMVTCKIMSTDRPGGNEPAHPSINGSPPLVLQRSKLVRIPWDFYLVLEQAGGTALKPGADATDDLVAMDYKEYPMTDIQLPTQAEVDAWSEYVSTVELGKPKAQQAA